VGTIVAQVSGICSWKERERETKRRGTTRVAKNMHDRLRRKDDKNRKSEEGISIMKC
jgi:hypothetical protein